jgi:hypothetical protein
MLSNGFAQKGWNPTHGSAWIVQIRPTNERRLKTIRIPPTAVGGLFKSGLSVDCYRNCNFAQIVVVGIPEYPASQVFWKYQNVRMFVESRLDLNNPPTAVGGIRKVLSGAP